MPMPGMPYHMGMSMPMSSIPSPAPGPLMGIKARHCLRDHHPCRHVTSTQKIHKEHHSDPPVSRVSGYLGQHKQAKLGTSVLRS